MPIWYSLWFLVLYKVSKDKVLKDVTEKAFDLNVNDSVNEMAQEVVDLSEKDYAKGSNDKLKLLAFVSGDRGVNG